MATSRGNNKNKRDSRNNHRHVYKKKILPPKRNGGTKQNKQGTVPDNQNQGAQGRIADQDMQRKVTIKGSSLINIDKFEQCADELTRHSTQCGGSVLLIGETQDGIASTQTGKCSTCEHTIIIETSPKVKGPRGYYRWEST